MLSQTVMFGTVESFPVTATHLSFIPLRQLGHNHDSELFHRPHSTKYLSFMTNKDVHYYCSKIPIQRNKSI